MASNFCAWRAWVEDGYAYWSLSDFRLDRCVLISPRLARFDYDGKHLPYFQVRSSLRRYIWESFTGLKVPPSGALRHQCCWHSGLDSRGLCINPLHLQIGSLDDNRLDARREEKFRADNGFWRPTDYEPLGALPDTQVPTNALDCVYRPDHLRVWSGAPQPLPEDVASAHAYCMENARVNQPAQRPEDACLLAHARALLDAIRANRPDDVAYALLHFGEDHCRTPKSSMCNAHRKRRRLDTE